MHLSVRHILWMAVTAAILCLSCSKNKGDEDKQKEEMQIENYSFAKGADISWLTQMEEDGVEFMNAKGEVTECTEIMKELGMNAIRLRVWVNPEGGWCAADDILKKAARAQKLGMRLMIDFHYSDSWADPSKQVTPAAWSEMDAARLADALSSHTSEVLQLLKDNDIEVEWVQVGNEVNNGMLHPLGSFNNEESIRNFVRFINAGHDAVKKIYPEAKVILHRSNGHDTEGFSWFLRTIKSWNARYDIIGMSLYPSWWENGEWTDWKDHVDACLKNMDSFSKTYGKPVIICEFGMPVSEPQMAKEALQHLMSGSMSLDDCHGVFYWEPQTDGKWKPSSYDALGWNAYNMGAFADGKPTAALDPFGSIKE